METAFSLGANLGDRLSVLSRAKNRLLEVEGVRLVAASPVYETDPVGVRPEYADLRYLNAVLVVESPLTAGAWLPEVHRIETGLGRVRTEDRFAPRVIDIDILYCGESCVKQGGLVVPHPRWADRRFVVQPLADVRPDLTFPGSRKTVREVLDSLPEGEKVQLFARDW
jgi:2-amino-4-hydroxy-6-hydroxymethyldihydropteridine diphosphokinase